MVYQKKAFRRFAKKPVRKFAGAVKKRYLYSRGAPKLGQIAKDVMYLKSQLNAEHKHLDTTFGSSASATYTGQVPTRSNPIIIPLELPDKGINSFDRIGNQIVVTHITGKYMLDFQNNTDRAVRTTLRARIIFAKTAKDVPAIDNLLNADPNDEYTPMSYVNEQEYKKFIWLKKLDVTKSYVEKIARSQVADTGTPTTATQAAKFYPRCSWNGRIKVEFATDSASTTPCTVNKPYLVLTSSTQDNGTSTNDLVTFHGTVRLSYIDN